eukprot:gnl/TRDRNA2_/TRDRNA2_177537_c0_seq1.p1 gnl/TRDRNA2_/TRDRNA2_177537_c0~~gnl/TRDRNA2_/TRDRNA2_177537_c0_seq1.p1  ORF type:complete len:722 (+),score=82.00 gnl/TRDRNA2_/TRDRNA2_177537_c0_seq1:59-2167(+)
MADSIDPTDGGLVFAEYCVGTGIGDITDPAIGLLMQGFCDSRQKTTGVESPLHSRAFIVWDPVADCRICIICADLWAGTHAVKSLVLDRLEMELGECYNEANLMLCGTHCHSAPGGFAGYIAYDMNSGGFDRHTVDCVVTGIVASVRMAHRSLAPGRLYVARGDLEGCGENRSEEAYQNNPEAERAQYASTTDREMNLLKFVRLDDAGREISIGALAWFAIHPTDLGQWNTLVSGDCKSHAANLFELQMGVWNERLEDQTFVAAVANSNAGDVSGNVEYGQIPDGVNDRAHMEEHGFKQFRAAYSLFESASVKLKGEVEHIHARVDMSNIAIEDTPGARTWPPAMGLSTAAGSTEDSVVYPNLMLKEGIVEGQVGVTSRIVQVAGTLGAGLVEEIPTALAFPAEVIRGHLPKPILFAVGAASGFVPTVLPLQIFRIGQLAIAGLPGEFNTMAGRRLRQTLYDALGDAGIKYVVLAGYANDYSQYIATKEEYDMQHYEGASTLYGPHTLQAYQQEFRRLALAMKEKRKVMPGPPPPKVFSDIFYRWTFRNLSPVEVSVKIYNVDDPVRLMTLPNGSQKIPARSEVAFPLRKFAGGPLPEVLTQVRIVVLSSIFNGKQYAKVSVEDLVMICQDGRVEVTDYRPPTCTPGAEELSRRQWSPSCSQPSSPLRLFASPSRSTSCCSCSPPSSPSRLVPDMPQFPVAS